MDEMNLTDSLKLLRDYADRGDEAAFRKLVERYLDLVYSAALRRVNGDAALAQDITQTVFTDLARKAASLRRVEMLGGWLHRHTGFVASNLVRKEQRRQIREQEAAQMNATSESPDALWQQLAPVLDDTIEFLEPGDRQAVLLRFFERRDFRSIGAALGVSDDAAQKRVSRALEKLRALLTERGVTLSVVLLSGLLAGKVIAAAPAGLAATISRAALAGAAGGGAGLALLKLSKTIPLKTAFAAIVAAVALWVYLGSRPASAKKPRQATTPVAALANTTNAPEDNQSSAIASASQAGITNVTGKVLLLNIITADSGKPIPDVEMEYSVSGDIKTQSKGPFVATRFGVCKIPIPDGTTEMKLVSHKDGFADTLLDWRPDRGEQIPAQYTLRVARAVPIGGTVVGPDGNPVEGAQVGFNNMPDPNANTHPQSDDFEFWMMATTDSQGRWQINRIGKEAIRTIYGSASRPDFVGTALIFAGRDLQAKTQLLAETYVFKLGHAVTVRGIVKDPGGRPIPNADVLVGQFGDVGSRKTNAGADGRFSVGGCVPGRNGITVEADGYAATTLDVTLADNSSPFEITLHPGKLLKLRVVDEDGNPVPHASVALNTLPDYFSEKEHTPPQIDFERQTDAEGRLKWDGAPDKELTFYAWAKGYMGSSNVKFQPDGTEHIITLGPALTISGTVTDATTGQPIPKFLLIAGWPKQGRDGSTYASWSMLDRFWQSFANGKFQYTYDEPVVEDDKNPGFMFKFEADGYASYITRLVPASDRSVRFDVALKPAPTTEVTVFTPDGGLATGVDIGLVSPGACLDLIPGGFSHNNIQSAGTLLQTDNRGQFALAPDPALIKVVAASPQGYAEATPEELAANREMNLLPWGRLEITYMTNGRPVGVNFDKEKTTQDSLFWDFDPTASTKINGGIRYTFAQVPPGGHEISFLVWFSKNADLMPVTINPGETTSITVDGTKGD